MVTRTRAKYLVKLADVYLDDIEVEEFKVHEGGVLFVRVWTGNRVDADGDLVEVLESRWYAPRAWVMVRQP